MHLVLKRQSTNKTQSSPRTLTFMSELPTEVKSRTKIRCSLHKKKVKNHQSPLKPSMQAPMPMSAKAALEALSLLEGKTLLFSLRTLEA
jgi:hypothetical protein